MTVATCFYHNTQCHIIMGEQYFSVCHALFCDALYLLNLFTSLSKSNVNMQRENKCRPIA